MKDSHDLVVAGLGIVVAALLLVAGELYLDYAQRPSPTVPDRYAASVRQCRAPRVRALAAYHVLPGQVRVATDDNFDSLGMRRQPARQVFRKLRPSLVVCRSSSSAALIASASKIFFRTS